MAGGNRASFSIVSILVFGMLAFLAVNATAFAQAGATGGTIGKTDKSAVGEDRAAEPQKARSPGKPRSGPRPADAPAARSNVFENPTINGIRVDRCMKWGPVGCGAPAANHWCRSKGFQRATNWSGQDIRPTIFQDPQSSVKVCDYFFCGGFTRIECQ